MPTIVRLFEKLVLEGFQSGLSWLTILKKRQNFRRAFHEFDAERMARFTDKDQARLMADAGIIRNRLKIEASIDNARAYLKLRARTSLAAFLWGFLDGRPLIHERRASSEVPPPNRAFGDHLEGLEEGRFPVCRTDHRLRLHAVVGLRQRPSGDLPPAWAVCEIAARVQGAGLMDIASGSARRHCDRHRTRLSYQA